MSASGASSSSSSSGGDASLFSPQEIEYEVLNFYDDRQPALYACYIICLVIDVFAVGLRFFARRLARNPYGWDDWMVLIGLCFTIVQIALGLDAVAAGSGKHIIFSPDPQKYVKLLMAMMVTYTIAAALIKFSTLLLYRRLFASSRKLMIGCWIVAGIIAAYSITQFFESIFQCTPVHKAWDQTVPGTCLAAETAATIPAAFNVFADFATVALPIPLIWRLKMSLKRKVQISGIFLLSGFVLIASIIRAVDVQNLSHLDATWANIDTLLWTAAENAVAIVCTCLPTFLPLYTILRRGHYCAIRESCPKCQSRGYGSYSNNSDKTLQGSTKANNNNKSWRSWGSKGTHHQQIPSTKSNGSSPDRSMDDARLTGGSYGGEKGYKPSYYHHSSLTSASSDNNDNEHSPARNMPNIDSSQNFDVENQWHHAQSPLQQQLPTSHTNTNAHPISLPPHAQLARSLSSHRNSPQQAYLPIRKETTVSLSSRR